MLLSSHHFATVAAVIDTGSVGAAANALGVSQSAVSHRIAEAERRLGVDLFVRRPARGVLPTPAGLTLYQAALRALPELERAETDVLRADGSAVDVVKIGVGSYDCYHWFPAFHRVAGEALPSALLELVVVGDSPARSLNESVVDVVLAPGQPDGRFMSMPLFIDELVLLVHPDHPAAKREWAAPAVIEGESFFTYNSEPTPGFEFDRFFGEHSPATVTVIQQTGAIAEIVASGLGISILSRWAVTPWLDRGAIVAVQCGSSGLALEWSALVRPGSPVPGIEVDVAELLATWLGDIAPSTAEGSAYDPGHGLR